MVLKRLLAVLILLFAATSAQAQTNPLGAGYSYANGQLYVQISPSLNSLQMPFSLSFDAIVPSITGGSVDNMLLTANPSANGAGGFTVYAYTPLSNDTFRFKANIQPAEHNDFTSCTHNGQLCWREPFLADGNRHHVCVRWTPSQGYLYLDGIVRMQTSLVGAYASTTDASWQLGVNSTSTWKMYDVRAYAKDIGAAGCVNLSNFNQQGVYPTTGDLSTGMVLHLPMDSTDGPCTNVSTAWSCPDTSGNNNVAVNGALVPIVAITAPPASPPSVSGTQNITVSCTLSAGSCTEVCYYMDGYLLGVCPTASPNYTFSWDTTKAIDGSHTLTAVGYAVSGQTTTSDPVIVTTANSVAAVTYQFDGVSGSDANTCLVGHPCKTSTKFNSLTFKGGDTVEFNNATTFTSDSGIPPVVCGPLSVAIPNGNFSGCSQNFYASSSPFTVTNYGSGTCNPLTGSSTVIPTGCAHIVGNAAGAGFITMNANNVVVENLAVTGNMGTKGISIEAGPLSSHGGSNNVTVQNNYVFNWSLGINTNTSQTQGVFGPPLGNAANFGTVNNCTIQDNYVTAPFGAATSPDTGIGTWYATTCLVQGNLEENAGNQGNDSQGNGLDTQNWPNPGGSATRNIFQFNVTHDNGGNHNNGSGGPYSLYSIGGDYTTFQFNEQYNQKCWYGSGYPSCLSTYGGIDNGAADDDVGSTHILHQYNYMHDNPMPFSNGMLMLSQSRAPCCGGNPGWGDNWFRYNILENNWVGIQGNFGNGGITINALGWYNNTLSSNISNPTNSAAANNIAGTCLISSSMVYNNLCINTAATGFQYYVAQFAPFCSGMDYNDFYTTTGQNNWQISNNAIVTTLAAWISGCSAGAHNLNVNPVLAGTPGTGGTCWPGGTTAPAGPTQPPSASQCPSVYQLTSGSAAVMGHGTNVDSSPTPNAAVDFYGNAVPNNGSCGGGSGYNIGADGACH